MKHALALVTILASLVSLNAHAATAGKSMFAFSPRSEVPTADGRWIQTDRVCGMPGTTPWAMSPAQDAFLNGRDAMKLEIKGDIGRLTVRIDGVKIKTNLIVDQLDHSIHNVPNNQKSIYRFEDDGAMTILSSDFGPGGTCPVGAVLFTTLKRY